MAIRLRLRSRPSPQAMTLAEHLAELRRRLLIMVSAFLAAGVVAFIVYPHILHFLQEPYCRVTPRHCSR